MDWLSDVAEPRFLVLYWVLVGLAVLVAVAGPALLPRPRAVREPGEDDLGPYELAMVAGGSRRVVDTALAGLLDAGTVRITEAGTVVPGAGSPRDPVQRHVLGRICHNRRLTTGGDDLGVCHRGAGRALTRRLLALGYLVRRRAGHRLHLPLLAVMALGVLRVVAEHGIADLANAAAVNVAMLSMLGLMHGIHALQVRWPNGMAVQSRRQTRAVTGFFLIMCGTNAIALAPDTGTGQVLAPVLGTAVVWWVVRGYLRRTTAPVTTERGRALAANVAAREPGTHLLAVATAPGDGALLRH